MADAKKELEFLTRGAVEVHSREDLAKKLASGRPLRVKLGVDPTAPELHLGHTVVLNRLRAFQDRGHVAILIIGDFTGRVGDPSGRDKTRPLLTPREIQDNADRFWEQAKLVLRPERTGDLDNRDPGKTVVVFNSAWLSPFVTDVGGEGRVSELFKVLASLTVNQLTKREDFQSRLKAGHPLSMLELLYPVFQAYDSVAVRSDVELGGNDQLFNLLVGRDLQRGFRERMGWKEDEPPQVAMTLPLLVGTDGEKKMSKSYGNYVAVQDSAQDIFGKTMRVSDEQMLSWYELLTSEDLAAVRKSHPMEAKKRLAELLTARFHDETSAKAARAEFERVFSKREEPADVPIMTGDWAGKKLYEILTAVGATASNNEARRLISGGAVKWDGEKVLDPLYVQPSWKTPDGHQVQVGSRRFYRLVQR